MARRSFIAAAVFASGAVTAGLLYAAYESGLVTRLSMGADAPGPGFMGSSQFGDWELLCAGNAGAQMSAPPIDRPDETDAGAETACRLRHEVRAPEADANSAAPPPPQVLLTVSLSLVGPEKRPALMLRLPATLKPDDVVTLRSGENLAIDAAVRECDEAECMAADSLTDEEWANLVSADALQVVFALDDSQRVAVDVGVDGLPAAVIALNAAQAR
jgi:invasion protein IalB